MTEWFNIRACCRSQANSVRVLEPAVQRDGSPSPYTGDIIEAVEAEPPPPNPAIACHEAGHAVVDHAFGKRIEYVRVGGADNYEKVATGGRKLSPRESAIVFMAGDLAANWCRRWVVRPYDEEVLQRIEALKACEIGRCDPCLLLFCMSMMLGDAPPASYLALFREIEVQTLEIIQRPAVVRAVRAVADCLMEAGTLDGEAVHAVIEPFIPFGSIALGEPANLGEPHRD